MSKMVTSPKNNIHFYEPKTDILTVQPYAVISEQDLATIMKRLALWAATIATNQNLAETFGEVSTAPIKLATELRAAIKNSLQDGIHPDVFLPACKFMSTMMLIRMARELEPDFQEMIVKEDQRWAELDPV